MIILSWFLNNKFWLEYSVYCNKENKMQSNIIKNIKIKKIRTHNIIHTI